MPQSNEVHNAKIFKEYRKLFQLFDSGAVFCAFDTETSGLSYKTDKIIELGAVKFDKTGVLARYGSFVKIAFPLPPVITKITGIKNETLSSAAPLEKVMAEFVEFSRDTILVAHNATFDWNFVNQELIFLEKPQLKNKIIDTLDLTRWAYPLNKKYSLQHLAAGMKINVRNAHRAYDDARVCMEVFLRALRDTMSVQKAEAVS